MDELFDYRIIANQQDLTIGEEIPNEIHYLNIYTGRIPTRVSHQHLSHVKQWLNKLVNNFTGNDENKHITYNNVAMLKEDVKLF